MMQSFDLPTYDVELTAGLRVGQFTLIDHIANGAVTEVWRARNAYGWEVALKLLSCHTDAMHPEHRHGYRFMQEAHVMRSMRHPNILPVYGGAFDTQFYWMVSAFMCDGNLEAWSDSVGKFGQRAAVAIADHILFALEYAHSKGIIHRDIKPANILIDRQHGLFVLSDFGAAQHTTGARITLHNKMIGTAAYMSPEQARGHLLDPRSDLYSIGCLLYRLVYGDTPFHAEHDIEIARMHVKAPLIFPQDTTISLGMRNLIIKAMEKQPDNRFKDAAAMRAALTTLRGEERDAAR